MSDFYTKVLSLKIRSIQLLFFPNITSVDENNAKLYGKKIYTFDKDGGEFVASYVNATIDNSSESANNAFLVVVHHFPKGIIEVGGGATYYQLESIYDFLQPMNVKAIRHPLFGERYELYLVFGTATMWGATDAQRKQNILYYLFGEGNADGDVDVLNHTFTIDGFMLQKGNKATTYQPYVEHLTNALKGTTEVAGGLVMTNVLMLKNEENEVTAGMSGLVGTKDNPENVLMWGGGTYQEAEHASKDTDYKKSENGAPITTLLKKDGTGKIGVFKIDDTKVVVDVPNQGKVFIDADAKNGGIFIKDQNLIDKIIVTPNSIDTVTPQDVVIQGETKSFVGAHDYEFQGQGDKESVNLFNAPIINNTPDNAIFNTMVSVSVRLSVTLEPFGTLDAAYVDNWLDVEIYAGNHFVNGARAYLYDSDVNNGIITKELTINRDVLLPYTGSDFVRLSVETFRTEETTNEGDFISLQPVVGIKSVSFDASTNISVTPTATLKPSFCTIVGSDGILSKSSDKQFFKVKNAANGQKIFAKGLSTKKGTAGSGELYVSSDFIDAFKQLCDALNEFFPMARTIGNNSTNADKCIEKVKAVKEKLEATSLIANS